jgi:patatin-like phospholipase/acyl hydrolase
MKTFRILALDGGGIKGSFSAAVLAAVGGRDQMPLR